MSTCDDGSERVTSVFDTVLACLILILLVIIVISNTMVLVLYCYDKQLRVAANLFICMMVIADLLVGMTLVPSVTVRLNPCLSHNTTLCVYKYVLVTLLVGLSLHFQTAIACDRWLAIKRPLQYTNIVTMKSATLTCILIWILCIGLYFLLPLFWRNESTACHFWIIFKHEFILYLAVPICVLLCSLIVFCYASLFCTARKLTRVGQSRVSPQHSPLRFHSRRESDFKAAKTLALVVTLNICTWLPAMVILLIMTVEEKDHSDALTYAATVLMFLPTANCAWNPWVYAMRLPAFKQATKRFSDKCAAKCCTCTKQTNSVQNQDMRSHVVTIT